MLGPLSTLYACIHDHSGISYLIFPNLMLLRYIAHVGAFKHFVNMKSEKLADAAGYVIDQDKN